MGRGDLTDEQWAMLEPLLPMGTKAGRPPVWPRRRLIDGIRLRVRTGVPWRDVPVEYGPWGRVYDLFRRWQCNGTWHLAPELKSLGSGEPTYRSTSLQSSEVDCWRVGSPSGACN
uniref:transposase n=1 Tax=Streptomyces stackebrandtii TaxID=3051177 RepID=UPI0028DB7E24|nr:transposase [Streptomyces sp. DSM 40976]